MTHMSKVVEKRWLVVNEARKLTEKRGSFTVKELAKSAGVPYTTASDWVTRLVGEGILRVVERGAGRRPARFAYVSKHIPPISPCEKIIALVDERNGVVEVCHKCLSIGAMSFCKREYEKAGGIVVSTRVEGSWLRIRAKLGSSDVAVGEPPLPSIGLSEAKALEDVVELGVVGFKGAGYSMLKTMPHADGVLHVDSFVREGVVHGRIYTKKLERVIIAVDDTDTDLEGATWELALSMANKLSEMDWVEFLSHKVISLYPKLEDKTGGNFASLVEFGVPSQKVEELIDRAVVFLANNTKSSETAVAVLRGLSIHPRLREFGFLAKQSKVSLDQAQDVAKDVGIEVKEVVGRRGAIGAVAALAFADSVQEALEEF